MNLQRGLVLLAFLLTSTAAQMLGLVGGFKQRDDHHSDPHVKEVAKFAVDQIKSARNEELELVKIVSVQTQVVAGTNYKLIFDAATQAQELHTFEATVYEPLGGQALSLSQHRLLPKDEAERSVSNASERSKPALLGAFTEVDPSGSDIKAAAEFAAEQLSQQSNSLIPFKVAQVLKARTRVAAGVVFDLQLKLTREQGATEIVQVEVQRSLGNDFSLSHSKTLEQ